MVRINIKGKSTLFWAAILIGIFLIALIIARVNINAIDNAVIESSSLCSEECQSLPQFVSLCENQCGTITDSVAERIRSNRFLSFFDMDNQTIGLWILGLAVAGWLISRSLK